MELNQQALYEFLEVEGLDPEFVEGGTQIRCTCPDCGERKLYAASDRGVYICFRCEAHGSIYDLLALLGYDEEDAWEGVSNLKLQPMAKRLEPKVQIIGPSPLIELPEEMIEATSVPAAMSYLKQRGLGPDDAKDFGIGYCYTGPYAYRVIVPVTYRKALYTFVARSILNDPICHCTTCSHRWKKVLYPPGSQTSRALFNLDRARRNPSIVLVEGVFDVMVRLQFSGVALLSSSISPEQVRLLQITGKDVIVCMDGDAAGRAAAPKIAAQLAGSMIRTSIATLPDGTDPASVHDKFLFEALDNRRPYIYP